LERSDFLAKEKKQWTCTNCGSHTVKYAGLCMNCGEFGTLEEDTYFTGKEVKTKSAKTVQFDRKKSVHLDQIDDSYLENRFTSHIQEFDRVCGGSITEGSVIIIGGEPGFGKSTLLSMVADYVSREHFVLYVSGEESESQMKKRMLGRLKMKPSPNLKVMYSNNIDNIENESLEYTPKLLIVDSINTIGSSDITGDPGDISQMKHIAGRLVKLAKENGITIIAVSQVTKDGDLAGPKKVEHMVDTVMYLEGDKHNDLRILRVQKNRFGSDQEVGVFKMVESGLEEITNPSEYLLKYRPVGTSGSAVICVSDSRPLLIEVQSLVSLPNIQNSNPRRTSEGFSRNRLNLLVAVIEKHLFLKDLAMKDVFVNVVGGINLREPGTDLGVAVAIYSSIKDLVVPPSTVFIGELGLAGEVRPVSKIEQLIREAERVGFEQVYLPKGSYDAAKVVAKKIELIPVSNIKEVVKKLF
jgi:DNA repair protein RadA/Sms